MLKNKVFVVPHIEISLYLPKIVFLQQETPIDKSTYNRMKEIDTKGSGLILYIC